MKIRLPILYDTPDSKEAELITGETNLDKCVIRECVFYNIDAITPYVVDGKPIHTNIYLSGEAWICPKSINEVEKMIDRSIYAFVE